MIDLSRDGEGEFTAEQLAGADELLRGGSDDWPAGLVVFVVVVWLVLVVLVGALGAWLFGLLVAVNY